jgi:hypothetical protein
MGEKRFGSAFLRSAIQEFLGAMRELLSEQRGLRVAWRLPLLS